MKITMENTDQIVTLNGALARVWRGVTEAGVEVQVLVAQVAVHKDADNSQFERELLENPPARMDGPRAFSPRMVL